MYSIDITCLSTNISQTLQVNNSRIARIKNANFSENYFYMNYFYMNLFYIFIERCTFKKSFLVDALTTSNEYTMTR